MSQERRFPSSLHLAFTIFHVVATLAAFCISIAVVVYALGANCSPDTCKSMIFITSTFFSSRQLETNYGWPVATERSQFGEVIQYPTDKDTYAFSHFYECMHTAQMADLVCPPIDSVAVYKECLLNTTNVQTRAALAACNVLSATNYVTHWPTSEEYTRCLFNHQVMRNSESLRASQNVFKACVDKTMWPFFENQQTVDSPIPLASFNWAIFVAVSFVITTSFAVYTVSWIEDGHVKQGEPQLFMRFGIVWSTIAFFWCLVFFIIFTVVAFNHTTAFEHSGGVPTTISTMFVTLGLLGTCLFYFGSEAVQSQYWVFWASTFSADAPDHYKRAKQQFGEYKEKAEKHYAKIVKRRVADPKGEEYKPILPNDAESNQESCLSVPLQPASKDFVISEEDVAKYYTPPLISTWADGYLADGCLFLGFAGATGHLTTDQSWNLFTLITAYRVLNMLICRFMYEAFMNNLSFDQAYNDAKFNIKNYPSRTGSTLSFNTTPNPYDKHVQELKHGYATNDVHLDIKVLALSAQFSALYIFSAICYIVFDGNYALADFGFFKLFFFVCFIAPETIRIVIHVWYQIRNTVANDIPWALLNTHFFIWIWDLMFRIIAICILFLGTNHELEGTREYLITHTDMLMGDFLRVLSLAN